jgi:hypothetical protein
MVSPFIELSGRRHNDDHSNTRSSCALKHLPASRVASWMLLTLALPGSGSHTSSGNKLAIVVNLRQRLIFYIRSPSSLDLFSSPLIPISPY